MFNFLLYEDVGAVEKAPDSFYGSRLLKYFPPTLAGPDPRKKDLGFRRGRQRLSEEEHGENSLSECH